MSESSSRHAITILAAFVLLSLPTAAPAQGGIPGVLAPGVSSVLVQEGFEFTEGPVGTDDGGLYFSDIRVNNRRGKTYHVDSAGKITLVREPTNGANGLALTKDGELLFAESESRSITKRSRDGSIVPVIDNHAGQKMLSPNDLIVDARGGIYFTDPGPRPVVPGRPTYVSYLPPGAKESIIIDDKVARPNGLTLTNNGRALIVGDTIGNTVFIYDVQSDGRVANKRPFAELRDIPAGAESGADGLAVDSEDRVYITTVAGVQVFDAKGTYLGVIKSARQGANVAFAGPGKQTLYITAREGLYRITLLSRGPSRLGK
jgi:gluconolactonase